MNKGGTWGITVDGRGSAYRGLQNRVTLFDVARPSRPQLLGRPAPANARAEPALSKAKGCPRHSGRDARATSSA